MGVDRAFVSSMERGLQNATLLTIWQIAQALGSGRQICSRRRRPKFGPDLPRAGGRRVPEWARVAIADPACWSGGDQVSNSDVPGARLSGPINRLFSQIVINNASR
ncbi:helix-turn-helix transcriptional regulator [Bradyrhizobium sp. CB1650]|uniref:helix-turn-helix transcriptional regulator n=1 Tax=Bradyrhizobium sp. CB1650 TaxID=3039153 RepID=UPI002434DC2A|nr:helix-turn-helix transcriptional regulator [Bradyrhizobium sp. CB1650]WGD51392.1 helix-turn-helix transcriptional regulator [Bradyrhizobium sp. CB1650]